MSNREGQSSLEFGVLLAIMLLAFIASVLLLEARSATMREQARQLEMASVADILSQEILMAHTVHDGYRRAFSLPPTIDRNGYTLTLAAQNEVTISIGDEEYIVFLPRTIIVTDEAGRPTTRLPVPDINISKTNDVVTLSPKASSH